MKKLSLEDHDLDLQEKKDRDSEGITESGLQPEGS